MSDERADQIRAEVSAARVERAKPIPPPPPEPRMVESQESAAGRTLLAIVSLAWTLTAIGACIGGVTFFFGHAESAPQQAAKAGMAIAWGVLPYCFARALTEIRAIRESPSPR